MAGGHDERGKGGREGGRDGGGKRGREGWMVAYKS